MISTSGKLVKELLRLEDDYITVKLNGKEYVINTIIHEKTHGDSDYITHLCLEIKDGGSGCIKRC